MNQSGLIVVLFFLLACHQQKPAKPVVALPYYITADFTPRWLEKGSSGYDSIHTIPPFSFIDQNGDTITEQTVAGKIYVADFFFTSCPGICPKLTKNLKLVQEAFKNDPDVLLLSHSVTPQKDTPATLKKYAANYGVQNEKWHLLTGNLDSIYTIARRAYFADEDLGLQRNNNDFLHTENILLIDRHRRIRGIYKGTSPAAMDDLIRDIMILKTENY